MIGPLLRLEPTEDLRIECVEDSEALRIYNEIGGVGIGAKTMGEEEMIDTVEALRQHQLVILRRLRSGPLTEFELAAEVAEHSGYNLEQCAENMAEWLEELRLEGLLWAGALTNSDNQRITAAALTKRGTDLIC